MSLKRLEGAVTGKVWETTRADFCLRSPLKDRGVESKLGPTHLPGQPSVIGTERPLSPKKVMSFVSGPLCVPMLPGTHRQEDAYKMP